MKPLFIPLRRDFFLAFERGEKRQEFRLWGPRWNDKTCTPGRPVVLSLGYGKNRRLKGVVTALLKTDPEASKLLPGWIACYGAEPRAAAVISIAIEAPLQ